MQAVVVKVELPVQGKKQHHRRGYYYYWSKDRKTWHTSIENQRAIRSKRKIKQIEAFLHAKFKTAVWIDRKDPNGSLPAEFGGVNPQILIDKAPLSVLKRTYVCVNCKNGLPPAPSLQSGEFHETTGDVETFEFLRPGNQAALKIRFGKKSRIELLPEEWEDVANHADDILSLLGAYKAYKKHGAATKALIDAEIERERQAYQQ